MMIDAQLDTTIEHVERLLSALTGRSAPPSMQHSEPEPASPEETERQLVSHLDELCAALDVTPSSWQPSVSVWQAGDEHVLCVDLPGVMRESLRVFVSGGRLHVSGERLEPRGADGGQPEQAATARPLWLERPIGRFHASIYLRQGGLPEGSRARFGDGVLELRVARSADARLTSGAIDID